MGFNWVYNSNASRPLLACPSTLIPVSERIDDNTKRMIRWSSTMRTPWFSVGLHR